MESLTSAFPLLAGWNDIDKSMDFTGVGMMEIYDIYGDLAGPVIDFIWSYIYDELRFPTGDGDME